jgi:L-lactate dehydrogenase complex protein LldE
LNVGLVDEARLMAGQTLDVLDATEGDVVIPSGSCTAMVTHHYERLFAGTEREEQARRVASRVFELTQFIVDVSGAEPELSCGGCTVAYHYSCHGLRELGLSRQADQLLETIDRVNLQDDRECCGFGGLFSIEMPAVSEAIMDKKLDAIEASGAEMVVGGDVSCLVHIAGGLRRRGSQVQVKHIAELMAGAE